MEQRKKFHGAMTELTVTYKPDGTVDHDALGKMVHWQIKEGIKAIFAGGISSEYHMMTLEEQAGFAEAVCSAAKGNLPVMCNVIMPGWRDAVKVISRFEGAGADAICITPPYFATYNDAAMTQYMEALIESTNLPVYIYNAPQTGNILSPQLIAGLAHKYPHLWGYKDSTQNVIHLQTLMAIVNKPGFEYIAGSDATTLPTLMLGGCGVISFISVAFPKLIIELCEAFFAGNYELAREKQKFVLKIRDILKKGGNSAGYKYACELMGYPIRGTRYPDSLLILSESLKKEIRGDLEKLGLVC